MWLNVLKHPERTPALGFYSQENPEVADWETKWAVEHGISFFVYCWYRTSQGGAVKTQFGSAIHDALFKSRFADKMKFTIMWENQAKGVAGVSSEADLMQNLLPFWTANYFRHPSYLKIDNKPVLFIYRPEFLVKDLGSTENVKSANRKFLARRLDERRICLGPSIAEELLFIQDAARRLAAPVNCLLDFPTTQSSAVISGTTGSPLG